jgi:hypothetical protein
MVLEVQDRYQLITLHMEMSGQYSDEEIALGKKPTPLSMFYPQKDKVFSIDELPNLFIPIFYCKYWGDKTECPYDDPVIEEIIRVLSKALPSPCKSRSMTTILPDTWLKGDEEYEDKKKRDDEEGQEENNKEEDEDPEEDAPSELFESDSEDEEEEPDENLTKLEKKRKKEAEKRRLKEKMQRFKKKLKRTRANVVFNVILRIVMGGLLGIYDHCNTRASFQVRRRIYKWFCLFPPGKNDIGNWIKGNKHLVIYILREYIFFCIQSLPALQDYLSENYYWFHMIKNAHDAMDSVRKHANDMIKQHLETHSLIDSYGESIYEKYIKDNILYADRNETVANWSPGDNWFSKISPVLASYNKSNLDYCHRPIEMSFLDMVIATIRDIDDSHYNDPKYTVSNEEFSEKEEEIVFRMVHECFDISEPISYEWLVYFFKVSLVSVIRLKEAEKLYMGETSRGKVNLVLKNMAEKHYYDYYVIKTFFLALKKKYSLIFYDLPQHIVKKQIEAYQKLYQTLPGEELHENAGSYYVCVNCGELKAKVVPSFAQNSNSLHKERECTLSFDRISINIDSGDIFCSRPASKTAPKKRSTTTDHVSEVMGTGVDSKKENKKQSKDNRKRKMIEDCANSPLVKVNMIGKILRTEKWGLVIICPHCLCLTTLGIYSFKDSAGYLSCGCMRRESSIDIAKKVLFRCILCQMNGKEEGNNEDDGEQNDKEKDREIKQQKEDEKKKKKKKRFRFHFVYDDVTDPEHPISRYVCMCPSHGNLDWLAKWPALLPLSKIHYAIQHRLTSHELSDGSREFVTTNHCVVCTKHVPSNDKIM